VWPYVNLWTGLHSYFTLLIGEGANKVVFKTKSTLRTTRYWSNIIKQKKKKESNEVGAMTHINLPTGKRRGHHPSGQCRARTHANLPATGKRHGHHLTSDELGAVTHVNLSGQAKDVVTAHPAPARRGVISGRGRSLGCSHEYDA
jgi:hypothetical protein